MTEIVISPVSKNLNLLRKKDKKREFYREFYSEFYSQFPFSLVRTETTKRIINNLDVKKVRL